MSATILTATAVVVGQTSDSDSPGAGARALSKEDDKAVRKIIAGIEEAWNSHDMKAYGRLFREDAQWVNVVGMHWRGRDAVMAAHAAYHATIFKNHKLKTDAVEIHSIGDGYAIAVDTTTNDAFTTPDGITVPKRQDRLSYVLAKDTDGWKIVHGHNVPVDANAAKHDPVNRAPKLPDLTRRVFQEVKR
jgi:uncharacterized protein (TIGR02246 family)